MFSNKSVLFNVPNALAEDFQKFDPFNFILCSFNLFWFEHLFFERHCPLVFMDDM